MNRFDYVKYDEIGVRIQAEFKKSFQELELEVEGLLSAGRAKSLAITALEEAYMWIGKAIRDDQLSRNKKVELQEERLNS